MEENKEHIIAEWLEGRISDVELDKQCDTTDMSADLRMITEATDNLEIAPVNSDALLKRIKADIDNKPSTAKVSYLKYWLSGAAALLIAVLAYTSLISQNIEVHNNSLTYATHTLPDGSTVMLNANTEIEYDEDFIDKRVLNLNGEAFFEVQKGSTFTVYTDNGDVTVLGTSFNVFSRDDNLKVVCKTGRVKVISESEHILNPGEKVFSIKGKFSEKSTIDTDQIASWQDGESKFKSSTLSEVILALTAQYGYKIEGKSLNLTQRFTGSFVHNDIDKATRMVFLPMGISYTLDTENRIIHIQ